jgi:hypothetical protein
MENEPTTKMPIPTHRESLFWILSPAFCLLLYPPILPSTLVETPLQIALFFCKTNPILTAPKPTQPSLHPVIPTEGTFPACRSGGICFNTLAISRTACLAQLAKEFTSQLCKTNPIFAKTRPMQPSLPQRFTKVNHPWPLEENEPNQTQNEPNQTQSQPKTRALLDPERGRRTNQTQFPRQISSPPPFPCPPEGAPHQLESRVGLCPAWGMGAAPPANWCGGRQL